MQHFISPMYCLLDRKKNWKRRKLQIKFIEPIQRMCEVCEYVADASWMLPILFEGQFYLRHAIIGMWVVKSRNHNSHFNELIHWKEKKIKCVNNWAGSWLRLTFDRWSDVIRTIGLLCASRTTSVLFACFKCFLGPHQIHIRVLLACVRV